MHDMEVAASELKKNSSCEFGGCLNLAIEIVGNAVAKALMWMKLNLGE